MHAPNLSELPAPPGGKKSWPWTEQPQRLSSYFQDKSPWPRISIITPSFNQARFIEETIRSVLLQGYPELEYIIIDGGSNDGTLEIIKKYQKWFTYWVSEPDKGQSHAINKGLTKASGEILAWLNSDDHYLPGTLQIIAEYSFLHPNAGAWSGGGRQMDPDTGLELWERLPPPLGFEAILNWSRYYLPQPSCFLNKKLLGEKLYLNEEYQMQMDFDLWLRISKEHVMVPINKVLSVNYRHTHAKTGQIDFLYRALAEKWAIYLEHAGIDFTAKTIEKYLSGDIELMQKLRKMSQKKGIKFLIPFLKRFLKKVL